MVAPEVLSPKIPRGTLQMKVGVKVWVGVKVRMGKVPVQVAVEVTVGEKVLVMVQVIVGV